MHIEILIGSGYKAPTIVELVPCSERHIRRLAARIALTGSAQPRPRSNGPLPIFNDVMREELQELIASRPSFYIEELQYYFLDFWDLWISESTICRAIQASGSTRKRLQHRALQRDEKARAEWYMYIKTFRPDQLVYCDESAVSDRTLHRKFGFSPRGTPAVELKQLKRTERWSLLPAYTIDGYLEDPLIVKAAVDGVMFATWLLEAVLPQMNPFPQPRSVLIMDNHSTHHVGVSIYTI